MACHWQVLQSHSGQLLTNQLVDELNRVEAAYESRTQSSLGRDIPTSEGGSDDIEAQANIYFHQMFSEQISVDAMIQMLARFKESTNKRCFPYSLLNLLPDRLVLIKSQDVIGRSNSRHGLYLCHLFFSFSSDLTCSSCLDPFFLFEM